MTEQIRDLSVKDFPPLLVEIPGPPKNLRIIGNLPDYSQKFLCVVGSRKYTHYGREACEKLISGLAGYPITVVSGLAMGIDAIAHRTALSVGLRTIAIPGSGLDKEVLYPSINRKLADEIVDSGGTLISEFEDNFRATQWSFPKRNRIMAGMSHAVLVVEAEVKSGTLITSRLATDYNRDVFTIPGSIFSKTSGGPHMLIRLGATPLSTSDELLSALGFEPSTRVAMNNGEQYVDCSNEEKAIIELLREPLTRDELLRKTERSVSETNEIITLLEIKNLIKESGGEISLK